MTFEVEDLLAPVADFDQRIARVVLRNLLAGLWRNPEPEHARTGVGRREARPYRRRFAVGRQRDLLRADEMTVVFDLERHGLAGVPGLGDDHVDDERGAFQHGARRLDAGHLDVAREALGTDADGKYRDRSRFHAGERFVERRVGGVGPVGDEDDAGERQAGEVVARPRQRLTDPGRAAAVLQLTGRLHAVGGRREAEFAQHEPLRQRSQQRPVGAKVAADELAARLVLAIRDLHASRIVDHDREKILLRNRCLQDERRPEETEDNQRDDRDAERRERGTVAAARLRHAQVGEDRIRRRRDDGEDCDEHRPRHADGEIALLKDDRSVLEKELEDRVEHLPDCIRRDRRDSRGRGERFLCVLCSLGGLCAFVYGCNANANSVSPAPTTTNWRPSSRKVCGPLLVFVPRPACQSGFPVSGS